jgi:ABC-type cobalamin/Fe3+-siderophores transport system ATPase subunit
LRIKKITATNILPVKKFEVDNLSDLVVIAGPNGVGKTRLISGLLQYFQSFNLPNTSFVIEATNADEEEIFGGKAIDTSNAQDTQKLRTLLQKNRKRRNLKSSVVYFESNRSIQNIKPLSFQFDFPDPWEEELGWNLSFGGLVNRWQDTQHAIFKKIQSQKSAIAARAIQLKREGHGSMNLDFSDPLDPFRKAFLQLLGPKTLAVADIQRQTLTYEYNGETRDINTLSSGEREVLNITFDFLLRKPSDCVVFFDEPELHLHPELLSKLISTLRDVGKNNQFILISHSPDVISSSLDDTVVFLTPPKEDNGNQGVIVKADNENTEALARLGQSVGVVALGKKIVLIEGLNSSLDKQTYTHILKNEFSDLVLLPSGGKGNLQVFESVMHQVLDHSIWGIQFFMLADRDALPSNKSSSVLESETSGKFRTLSKYHLENYFLDSKTLANCFIDMEDETSWLRDPEQIEIALREIAKEHIGYAAALITAKHIRDRVGNIDVMVKNAHTFNLEEFTTKLHEKCTLEETRISSSIKQDEVESYAKEVYQELENQIQCPDHSWKSSIPGKPIFAKFCAKANIPQGRLKTLYISKATEMAESSPFHEIRQIFKDFSEIK